jgi:Ca2+-binding EF-hand superfamily protein
VSIRDLFRPLPFSALVLAGAAVGVFLLSPDTAVSQGRGGFDPNRLFDMMSGGKDFIDMNDIQRSAQRDPSAPERYQQFMQANGITNGQLTREQFALYMQQRMAQRGQGGPGGDRGQRGPGGQGGPPTMMRPGSNGPLFGQPPTGPANEPTAADLAREEDRWKQRFMQYDQNHDGVLSPEEAPDTLRGDFEKWDKNHNGVIEWEEYKEYATARFMSRFQDRNGGDNGGYNGDPRYSPEFQQSQAEEKPRIVYRAGFIPKDLPAWFLQTPHKDPTQISLAEWLAVSQKGTNDAIAEFRKYDLNLDGFITIEEALAADKSKSGKTMPIGSGADGKPLHQEETTLVIAGPGSERNDNTTMVASYGNQGPGNGMRNFGRPGGNPGGDPRMNMFGPRPGGNSGGDPRMMMRPGGDPRSGGDSRSRDRSNGGDPRSRQGGGDPRNGGGDPRSRGPRG